jgi:signal transduction histidine kinase
VEPDAGSHLELLPQLQLDELLAELQTRLQAVLATRDRMRGLLEAVVAIGSGLDLESTLRRIVEAAVGLVDARYGALGVIGEGRRLAEFIPVGLSRDEIARIDHWPEGRGLLGLLIDDPRPLRLARIGGHASSSGFPEGHPPMGSFLGVPVRVRDEVFGNLYLTDKRGGGEFTEDDEAVLVALGAAAGVAVENARLYDAARRQQRWIAASAEVTTRLLSGSPPDQVLADITRQVLHLSGADLVVLALPDDEARWLTITYAEGDGADVTRGLVLPAGQSLSGRVLAEGEPVTCEDFAADERVSAVARGAMSQVGPAVLFPLGAPGNVRGVLTVGRRHGGGPFPQEQADMVAAFAAQAGVALELAASRTDAELLSLYEDRDRIARDLHDLVIQRLYATGMSLEGTMPMVTRPEVGARITNAVDALDETIKEIRSTIYALQSRGTAGGHDLRGEVVALAEEMTEALGFAPSLRLGSGLGAAVGPEVAEQALAALREALSNTARHAGASQVDVTVDAAPDGMLTVQVIDNGTGIPEGGRRSGLRNLANRAEKLGGELRLEPADPGAAMPGTRLEWRVPQGLDLLAAVGVVLIAEDAHRVGRRLGAALHAQLGEQRGDIVLHGLLRQEHPLADLPVGQPLADQLQDLALLRGQPGQRITFRRLMPQPGHQLARRPGVQHRLAGGHGAHRADQIGAADLLQHVARGSGHDRVEQRLVITKRGEHQARHLGHPGPDLPAHRHPVAIRQPHVEHGHVRPEHRDTRQRRRRGASLTHDPDAGLAFQQVTDAPAHHLVIIEEEHRDRLDGLVAGHRAVGRTCHLDS